MKNANSKMVSLLLFAITAGLRLLIPSVMAAEQEDLLAGHPRPSYEDVADIGAMEEALRRSRPQPGRTPNRKSKN